MEALLVHPKDETELAAIKAFMHALNIQFESKEKEMPSHVLQSIKKGLAQMGNGETISLADFKEKHFRK